MQQTPLKLTVISSLAKGADQIVARVVCELVTNPEQRNRYLEAVLPLPKREYENDFSDQSDLDGFRNLLALDQGKWDTNITPTVICPLFPNESDSDDPTRTVTRPMAYAKAGRHVVDTSEIVIAVWDPSRVPQPGGPEDTVRYAVDSGRVVFWIDPQNLAAGSYVLRRPVPDEESVEALPRRTPRGPDGMRAYPLPSRASEISKNFHRLAGYNRDGAVDRRLLQQELDEKATQLSAAAHRATLPETVRQVLVDVLLPHGARADHLSTRYSRLRNVSAKLWPTTAAIVVSLMAFQIIFLPAEYRLAWVELGVLALGAVSYRVSLANAWHEK